MFQKSLQIPDEINDIITALKVSFSISSITESLGVSTIITNSVTIFDNLGETMLLKSGMIVTLDDINYQVSNVVNSTVKSFDITAINLTSTAWNVAASFKFGSRQEINQILQQETTDENKLKRFPLIWLFTPIEKDFDNQVIDFESELVLSLSFKANKTDRYQVRLDGNIKTILEPLLKLFLLHVQSSDFNYMFEFEGYQKALNVNTNNFYFYGTSDQSKSVLNTTTDAIEVSTELKFKKQFEYGTPAIIYTPQFQAVYDSWTEKPTDELALSFNTMVKSWVDSGIWDKKDAIYVFNVHTNDNGEAQVNWKTPGTNDAILVNNAEFRLFIGFAGNGTTMALDSDFNLLGDGVNYTQNSASISVYNYDNIAEAKTLYGSADAVANSLLYPKHTNGNAYVTINNTGFNDAIANADASGHFISTRNGANTAQLYKNKVKILDSTEASTAVPDSELGFLASKSKVASAFQTHYPGKISLGAIGGEMTAQNVIDETEAFEDYRDIINMAVPVLETGTPTAGKRIKVAMSGYPSAIYYNIYLPTNYNPNNSYSVIFDTPGNVTSEYSGLPDDIELGFGLSEDNFIWVNAGFIDTAKTTLLTNWWGNGAATDDPSSTVDYWLDILTDIKAKYNIKNVILSGFSRGAIGCTYVGCWNDAIASKWTAFIASSHYDGGTFTPTGATGRITRVMGRKTLMSAGEFDSGRANTLTGIGILDGLEYQNTFIDVTGGNHSTKWTLQESSYAIDARRWVLQFK